jgi:hypothetical protein
MITTGRLAGIFHRAKGSNVHATIDSEYLSRDVRSFVRAKEQHGGGDVFRLAHAAERNLL